MTCNRFLVGIALALTAIGPTWAGDLNGRWRGKWTDDVRGHEGRLSGRFRDMRDGNYRVTFSGTFRKVIPFVFTTKLKVVERDGDIFGRTVNHASRLASLATAGQVVVSEAVASVLEAHGMHRVEPLGEVTLKGVAVPVRAFLVSRPS